jgi:hypothetical protein
MAQMMGPTPGNSNYPMWVLVRPVLNSGSWLVVTPALLALESLRQEDCKFKDNTGYIVNLRPAWAILQTSKIKKS